MSDIDHDLERDLTLDMAADAILADPISAKITEHRDAINRASREIMAIERERDLSVREFEGQLETAEFVYTGAVALYTREISKAQASASGRIDVQRQLLRSAEAALQTLEPFKAPKDEDAPKRRVPRMVAGQ